MKRIIIISVMLLGSFLLNAQRGNIEIKVDSIIDMHFEKGKPGGVVGIVKDRKTIYSKSFGMANLDYRIPVTDSTLFNLASKLR